MISLRGPLCAGEAFSGSLRSLGRGVVSRGETWGPASSFRYAPLLDPTYLHWVGYAKKGGSRRPRESRAGGAIERDTGDR